MRMTIGRPSTGGRPAAYKRFHDNNPGYVAEWRRQKREKQGVPARDGGRPKKRKANFFMANVASQNQRLIAQRIGHFELIPEESSGIAFKLRPSNIHGIGVFISDAVPADSYLMEYKGEFVSTEEADVRERNYQAAGTDIYLFGTESGDVIDATVKGNVARFINHSCSPNCITESGDDRRSIRILSLRALKAAEEITIDYCLKPEMMVPTPYKAEGCISDIIKAEFA